MTTDQDERLARLQQRSPRKLPAPPVPDPTSTHRIFSQSSSSEPIVDVALTPRKKRRSPAQSGKIVAAGASATAVLGLIAAFGAASAGAGSAVPTVPAVPPAIQQPAVTTPAEPRIIVVVLESTTASTGEGPPPAPSVTTDGSSEAATEIARQVAAATPALAPVAVPKAVDLAVPAPAQPVAPPPQAASGGS
jgi:hypothetical protein